MSAMTSEQIVLSVQDLPSLPAIVMELLGNLEQEDIDVALLAQKVTCDPALTAKTLRLANSSLFGLQVKVTTVQQAITYLGFQTTRNLIMAAALTGCFPSGRCPGFNDKIFWRHSIATAICARLLARRVRFNQDVAFTAGLLHDIGRLVLVTSHPEAYRDVLAWQERHDSDSLKAERAVLGIDHVEAGVALAEQWHFADTLRQAIAFYYVPETPGAGFLAAIVHVANAVAHALDLAGDDRERVPQVSNVAWDAMGLNGEAYLHLFREVEVQFGEMAAILTG